MLRKPKINPQIIIITLLSIVTIYLVYKLETLDNIETQERTSLKVTNMQESESNSNSIKSEVAAKESSNSLQVFNEASSVYREGFTNYLFKYNNLRKVLIEEVNPGLFKVRKAYSDNSEGLVSRDGFIYIKISEAPIEVLVNSIKYSVFKVENNDINIEGDPISTKKYSTVLCRACIGYSGYIAIPNSEQYNIQMNLVLVNGNIYGLTNYQSLNKDLIKQDILIKLLASKSGVEYKIVSDGYWGPSYSTHGDVSLYRVETEGKQGFMDQNGKLIIPCIYDQVDLFNNGRAVVRQGNSTKYIDINNNESPTLNRDYDKLYDFSSYGYAVVSIDGFDGVIDLSGKEIVPPVNNKIKQNEGFFICLKDDLYGVFNWEGRVIIPFEYTYIDFLDEYFFLAKGGAYVEGYKDDYNPRWEQYGDSNSNHKGRCGLADRNYNIVIPVLYDDIFMDAKQQYLIAQKDNVETWFDQEMNCVYGCN